MEQRLRPLTEAECYARCYGARGGVRIVGIEVRRRPREVDVTGEQLRDLFDERLGVHEPEAEAA